MAEPVWPPRNFATGELVTAAKWNANRTLLDDIKGSRAGQTSIELDAQLQSDNGIGSQFSYTRNLLEENEDGDLAELVYPRRFLARNLSSSGSGLFQFLAEKATAPSVGEHCIILFALRDPGGTEEVIARLRWVKDTGTDVATGYFEVANAGSWAGSAPITMRHLRRVGIGTNAPNVQLEIGSGDINITGTESKYVGLRLWREAPAGTLNHLGPVTVTGQIIIGATTGTAPIVGQAGAAMARNLNGDLLQGVSWPSTPTNATATVSIAAANTNYTAASTTVTGGAGLYFIEYEVSIGTVPVGTLGFNFTATCTGISRVTTFRAKTTNQVGNLSGSGYAQLAAGATVTLTVRRDGGATATSATGYLLASWVGP